MLPPDGGARVRFELPQQWLVGVARHWDDGTVLAAGGSWQDWSAFGQSRLELPDRANRLFPGGLRDTWGASVGIRHPVGRASLWSAGVGYESSPAPSTGVPAYFPAADQWRFASGFERPVSDAVRVRASFSMTRQGDAAVVQTAHPLPLPGIPPLTGTYQHTSVYALGLAADFRF
jgi:long-subunit fatty acid transport protein